MVIGYLSAVCFKWSPHTEHYLRALALPVWAALLFYIGECVCEDEEETEVEPAQTCWLSSHTSMQTLLFAPQGGFLHISQIVGSRLQRTRLNTVFFRR